MIIIFKRYFFRPSGKNSKKQACIYRLCTWKNPSGKRTPGGRSSRKGNPNMTPQGTPVTPSMAGALMNRGGGVASAGPKQQATPTKRTAGGSPVATVSGVKRRTEVTKRGRKSISVVSPAVSKPPSGEGRGQDDGPAGQEDGGRNRRATTDAAAASLKDQPFFRILLINLFYVTTCLPFMSWLKYRFSYDQPSQAS